MERKSRNLKNIGAPNQLLSAGEVRIWVAGRPMLVKVPSRAAGDDLQQQ